MNNNRTALIPKVHRGKICNYSVRFSPFESNKLALAQAQYFGIVGAGAINETDTVTVREWQTPEAVYDVCFNEGNQNQILSVGDDGNVRLWDLINNSPIRNFKEHTQQVFGCDWNHINKRKFLTAAYDRTIKLWDINMVTGSQATFNHEFGVYAAIWHPTHESIFGSCSGDQTIRVWDIRSGKDVKKIMAHSNEVLSIDFNKYENFIASSSTDGSIRLWDLRSTLESPIMELKGHQLAVRRIKFSPYHANLLASASQFDHHTEFVVGLDFNLFVERQIATASWDKSCSIFKYDDNPKLLLGK
ncbi:wd40 repeat-containing protein [Stylonychia lemnae]|uniref:Peroxin-7 n=1 Tax=Stylonychia lemnae TaxID=5949 RepID=A0A078ADY4_STYLE|nr:wd40 repeat-containing protein [Stylonychia lemnae]|eukprot:CDW80429.1 wd40 repeat-containing protein [Stylonychia lemnae]